MSAELVKVPFHDGEILCAKDGRQEYVIIKPLCETLGLQARAQQKRIQRESWGKNSASILDAVLPGSQGVRRIFCLHRKRIAMWLATITTSQVKSPDARAVLERYQEEAADVLDAYFGMRFDQAAFDRLSEMHARLQERVADLTATMNTRLSALCGKSDARELTSMAAEIVDIRLGVATKAQRKDVGWRELYGEVLKDAERHVVGVCGFAWRNMTLEQSGRMRQYLQQKSDEAQRKQRRRKASKKPGRQLNLVK